MKSRDMTSKSTNFEEELNKGARGKNLLQPIIRDIKEGNKRKKLEELVILTSAQQIKVFLYGECGGAGYKATTWYNHWDSQSRGGSTQSNSSGGYFLRGHGTHIYFSGEFRNFGDRLVNFGKAYAINEGGAYNEFVIQKLNKNSDQAKLLGLSMTWLFENETTVSLDDIEKVQTI